MRCLNFRLCRPPALRTYLYCLTLAGLSFSARTARATAINSGIEAGVVKRTTSSPGDLDPGFGYGAHVEVGPIPELNFGIYFLQSINAESSNSSTSALFNTLGLRTKLVLPISSYIKAYGFAGIGTTWTKYRTTNEPTINGHSWEAPLGLGVGHKVFELFQLYVEGAYRPSFSFGGTAYDTAQLPHPTSGWSAFIGFAFDISHY